MKTSPHSTIVPGKKKEKYGAALVIGLAAMLSFVCMGTAGAAPRENPSEAPVATVSAEKTESPAADETSTASATASPSTSAMDKSKGTVGPKGTLSTSPKKPTAPASSSQLSLQEILVHSLWPDCDMNQRKAFAGALSRWNASIATQDEPDFDIYLIDGETEFTEDKRYRESDSGSFAFRMGDASLAYIGHREDDGILRISLKVSSRSPISKHQKEWTALAKAMIAASGLQNPASVDELTEQLLEGYARWIDLGTQRFGIHWYNQNGEEIDAQRCQNAYGFELWVRWRDDADPALVQTMLTKKGIQEFGSDQMPQPADRRE